MVRRYLPRSTEEMIHWYERYVSPIALITGFLIDNFFLLDRIDVFLGNALLFLYLGIAAASIAFLNLVGSGRLTHRWILAVAPYTPIVMQFAFGALFSGFLALYSRSAGLLASWVFVIVIAALLVGNERFRRLYTRFIFQISILFTAIFAFLIFLLPVIFHAIGPWMFVLSGVTSITITVLFLRFIGFLMPELLKKERTRIARTIAVIFIIFNILFFSGAIPPLPLALKFAGVYHSVERTSDGIFRLGGESESWYEKYLLPGSVFHHTPGSTVYAYSAVFAPTGISTVILHEWQQYDEPTGEWLTRATVRYPIIGGRDGGYRGYSFYKSISEGKWRVNVITQYGQLIGRISFTVVDVSAPVAQTDVQN